MAARESLVLVFEYGQRLRRDAATSSPIRAALDLVALDPAGDLRVEVLAAAVGMSRRHFAREFRRHAGATPGDYEEGIRIEAAQHLLTTTAATQARVARAVGFGSEEALRQAFRRRVGVTPGAYRDRFQVAARCCHTPVASGVFMSSTTGEHMASDMRVPPATISGLQGALVKRMARRKLGEVPEPLGVLWHNRPVLKALFGFMGKADRWDACDPQLKAFAHMATASLVGCGFCLDLGYFQARHDGLDVAKAREVPAWRDSDAFTPLEREVLAYAEAVTATPPTVTDAMAARLREQLGPAGLVELTAFIGAANLASRTNASLGVEVQGFSTACGLPPLARPHRDLRSSA